MEQDEKYVSQIHRVEGLGTILRQLAAFCNCHNFAPVVEGGNYVKCGQGYGDIIEVMAIINPSSFLFSAVGLVDVKVHRSIAKTKLVLEQNDSIDCKNDPNTYQCHKDLEDVDHGPSKGDSGIFQPRDEIEHLKSAEVAKIQEKVNHLILHHIFVLNEIANDVDEISELPSVCKIAAFIVKCTLGYDSEEEMQPNINIAREDDIKRVNLFLCFVVIVRLKRKPHYR